MKALKPRAAPHWVRSALRFAAYGAVALGLAAFVHVVWDGYRFQASGRVPVDDPLSVTLGITLLGVCVGGVVGAILGVVISLARRRTNDTVA